LLIEHRKTLNLWQHFGEHFGGSGSLTSTLQSCHVQCQGGLEGDSMQDTSTVNEKFQKSLRPDFLVAKLQPAFAQDTMLTKK